MNDLEAAAENAELTGQIRSFMTWLGEGRKLTQTGRIGLADARHLVELLGTGDKIDPEIHGRVYKTKSSEELGNVLHFRRELPRSFGIFRIFRQKIVILLQSGAASGGVADDGVIFLRTIEESIDVLARLLEPMPN